MKLFVNGIHLHYETCGKGRPLILLHGNGETHNIFDRAIPLLAERFTVYAIDSRGHGESDPVESYHYNDMAEDVHAFITALSLERPVLYGFSDGGIIGLLLSSIYPELLSCLIVSGANTDPNGIRDGWRHFFERLNRRVHDPKIDMMLVEPNITPDMLSRITVPCLVLAGGHDFVKRSDTKHIAASIPNSELNILPLHGHGSYIVHKKKIAALILGFVEKHGIA
ncbi:MAG: alpha/beta hydrolase [Eubacteriales bacterium]|nr:alpha/beta hydrolase [Eubacteriales bacterium]